MTIEEAKNITNNAGIYAFHNLVNGKYYIGQAIRLRKRLLHHLSNFNNNRYDAPLYRAFKKYGLDNFEYLILEELKGDNYSELSSKMNKLEKEYIIKYNSYCDSSYNQITEENNKIDYKSNKNKDDESKQEKVSLIYIYIIDGPYKCKYITLGNDLSSLNNILRYHDWPELTYEEFKDINKNIIIKNKYIISNSKEKLQEKINIYKTLYK